MDEIRILQIEEDGTITFETDQISGQNHESADKFLSIMEDLCGTKRITIKRKDRQHIHTHSHGHKAGM